MYTCIRRTLIRMTHHLLPTWRTGVWFDGASQRTTVHRRLQRESDDTGAGVHQLRACAASAGTGRHQLFHGTMRQQHVLLLFMRHVTTLDQCNVRHFGCCFCCKLDDTSVVVWWFYVSRDFVCLWSDVYTSMCELCVLVHVHKKARRSIVRFV